MKQINFNIYFDILKDTANLRPRERVIKNRIIHRSVPPVNQVGSFWTETQMKHTASTTQEKIVQNKKKMHSTKITDLTMCKYRNLVYQN
jgi:hypothetical protein